MVREKKGKKDRKPISTRQWVFRLVALVCSPLFFLLIAEGVLRVAGYGHSTSLFMPLEGTSDLIANPHYCRPFFARNVVKAPHPFRMDRDKPPQTVRVFILGGSAAAGTPDPSFGFARILERMVRMQSNHDEWEFINLAIRGINSHVVRPMSEEVAKENPDLVILYLGNNEAVGNYAPAPNSFNITEHPNLIRLSQWIKSRRLGQWLVHTLESSRNPVPESQDMDFFRDHRFRRNSPLRSAVHRNFEANLKNTLSLFHEKSIPVLLSTLMVNLSDCPPLGSLHRESLSSQEQTTWKQEREAGLAAAREGQMEEALGHFRKAEEIDTEYAEIHYLLGKAYLTLGQTNEAVHALQMACDLDALPFRATSDINRMIREEAERHKGDDLIFLDAEAEFIKRGIPGNNMFHEHVHFNFQGDYTMAVLLFEKIRNRYPDRFPLDENGEWPAPPSLVECARSLALTLFEQNSLLAAIVALKGSPPFLDQWDHAAHQKAIEEELEQRWKSYGPDQINQTLLIYQKAMKDWPDDWMLHFNLGNFLDRIKKYEEASVQFIIAADAMPHFKEAQLLAARALVSADKKAEATRFIRRALLVDPEYKAALEAKEYLEKSGLWN